MNDNNLNKSENTLTLSKYISKMQSETRDIYKYMADDANDDQIIKELEKNPKEFVEENFSGINREELSKRMGMSKEALKKRLLHHDRPITRDFVIALCSQLQLGFRNTNYALKITGQPLLYGGDKFQKNSRDQMLIYLLQHCSAKYMSLNEINNKLIKYNELPLDIKSAYFDTIKPHYIILETQVKVLSYDEAIYNVYDSLETLFDIDYYHIKASAILKSNSTNNLMKLELYNGTVTLFNNTDSSVKYYKNYRDLNAYSDVLDDLNRMIKSKRKEIFLQLDDSKNYNKRISARYTDLGIQVFSEAFNFIIPEKNEYFFIEYFEHRFHFYITNRSQFMHYQSKNIFNKYIKKYDPLIQHEFNSIEEIKSFLVENPSSDVSSYFDKNIISTFEELYNETINLLMQIKMNKIYIRNPEIYDGPNSFYDMCKYFGLDNNFEFVVQGGLDDPEPIFKNNKNCIEVDNLNSKIMITHDDIYNAFIYGLNTVEDICSIKSKCGTIQNWINNL